MADDNMTGTASEPLTYHMDLTQVQQNLERARRTGQNISGMEQIGSTLLGAGLLTFGVSRRSIPGALLACAGIALLERGVTGHCGLYEQVGINTAEK